MLARTPGALCIECGLDYWAEGFSYDHGRVENGPAYWSDRGLLCSPGCAGQHWTLRVAEGTLPTGPVDCPVEVG